MSLFAGRGFIERKKKERERGRKRGKRKNSEKEEKSTCDRFQVHGCMLKI